MKRAANIPEALAHQAKRLCARGLALRDHVARGFRAALARRSNGAREVDFVFPTVTGNGLVVDLAARDLIQASYRE